MSSGIIPNDLSKEQNQQYQYLIEIATQFFAREGFHGTTYGLLSQASEVPVWKLYDWFESKEKLLLSVLEHAYMQMEAWFLRHITPYDREIESLNVFIEELVKFCIYHVECRLFSALACEMSSYNESIRRQLNNIYQMWVKNIGFVMSIHYGEEAGRKHAEFFITHLQGAYVMECILSETSYIKEACFTLFN